MASIKYDGKKIDSGVSKLYNISSDLSTYSSSIYDATKIITSANGFDQYISGIRADTFSNIVDRYQSDVQSLIDKVRQGQMSILTYSKDKNDINLFLNSLSEEEKERYNLDDVEKLKDRSSNIFVRAASTLGVGVSGILEGILDFGETGADLLVMAGSGLATIFTAGIDLFTGRHGDDSLTQRLWNWTKGFVADKKVENIFNRFYSNTSLGRSLRANAYGFETVRSVGKGVGYTAGVVGLTIMTGGLAGGATTFAGSISSSQLAMTAGVLGFSNGTEEAWADGANLLQGVTYGLARGAWEGGQWFLGGKISSIGGQTLKSAAARVGLNTAVATSDAFVSPGLKLLYKNDPTKSLGENYSREFEQSGGFANVAKQAAFGATLSTIGEATNARRLLKENKANVTETVVDPNSMEVVGTTTAVIDGKVVEAEIVSPTKTTNTSSASSAANYDTSLPVVQNQNTSFVTEVKEAVVTKEFRHNAAQSVKDNITSLVSGGTTNINPDVLHKEMDSNKLANIIMGDKTRAALTQARSVPSPRSTVPRRAVTNVKMTQ